MKSPDKSQKENIPYPAQRDLVRAINEDNMSSFIRLVRKYPPGPYTWKNCYAIHWAIRMNKLEFVHFLLNSGVDPNHASKQGNPPLQLAVRLDQWSVVRDLLKLGADPNPSRYPGSDDLVNVAVENRSPLILGMLLDHGSRFDLRTKRGYAPVEKAIRYYLTSKDLLRLLLDAGATPNSIDPHGYSPMTYAVMQGYLSAYKLLVEAGGDPYLLDKKHEMDSLDLIDLYNHYKFRNWLVEKELWIEGDDKISNECHNVSPWLRQRVRERKQSPVKGPPTKGRVIRIPWNKKHKKYL
jgi:ankyrin repeat protein